MKAIIVSLLIVSGSTSFGGHFENVNGEVVKSEVKMSGQYKVSQSRLVIEGKDATEAIKVLANSCLSEEGPEQGVAKSINIKSTSISKSSIDGSDIYRIEAVCKF